MFHRTSQQRNQSAGQDQHVQVESEPEGKVLAPPPFQLQASSIGGDDGEEESGALQLKKASGMVGFSPELSPPSSDKFHSEAAPQPKEQNKGVIQRKVDRMPDEALIEDFEALYYYAYEDPTVGSKNRTFTDVVHAFEKSGNTKLIREVRRIWLDVNTDLDYGRTYSNRVSAYGGLSRIAAIINSVETRDTFTASGEVEKFLATHDRSFESVSFMDDITSSHRKDELDYSQLEANFTTYKLVQKGKSRAMAKWAVIEIGRNEEGLACRWIELAESLGGEGVMDFITAHKDNLDSVHDFLISKGLDKTPKDTLAWVLSYEAWLKKNGKEERSGAKLGLGGSAENGGIPNTGTDCFMNSVIQMLTQMDYMDMNLPERLKAIIHKADQGAAISAGEIRGLRTYLHNIGMVEQAFGQHEDAAEFLGKLLDDNLTGTLDVTTHRHIDQSDSLEETGQERGPVPADAIRYDGGGNLNTPEAPQSTLKVPVTETASLVQWLNQIQGPGIVDTFNPPPHDLDTHEWSAVQNEWRSVRKRTTTVTFNRLPNPLCIQLLRFDNYGQKIQQAFHMPGTFTLTENLGDGNFCKKTYRLKSFTYHQGEQMADERNHYWTHRRGAGDNFNEHNDSHVTPSLPVDGGGEHAANHDLDHGYLYMYEETAAVLVAAHEDSTGTDLYDRAHYRSHDEMEMAERGLESKGSARGDRSSGRDPESKGSRSNDFGSETESSDVRRRQIWYGAGAHTANRNPNSADSDTEPENGKLNEGPCAAICTDLVRAMEATGADKHCMLGVAQGLSGTFYVTMSGRPSAHFRRAVATLKAQHGDLEIQEVVIGKIARITNQFPDSDQGSIDAGDVRTFKGSGTKGQKLPNYPSGGRGVETAKGMPGTCALPKLLHHIIGVGDAPKHASEKWFAMDNKTNARKGTVSVTVADNDRKPTDHRHGETVPSCKTCRAIVEVQMEGVAAHVAAMRKDLATLQERVREQNEHRQQMVSKYVQLALAEINAFNIDPKEINDDYITVQDFANLRKYFITAVQIMVEEAIDNIMAEEAALATIEDNQPAPEAKETASQRRRRQQREKRANKRGGKKNKQKIKTSSDSQAVLQSKFPAAFQGILTQFDSLKSIYSELPPAVFKREAEPEVATPASDELIFGTGLSSSESQEDLDLSPYNKANECMEEMLDALKQLELSGGDD